MKQRSKTNFGISRKCAGKRSQNNIRRDCASSAVGTDIDTALDFPHSN
jgi:hypothetical protein